MAGSKHGTLTATEVATVSITGSWDRVCVIDHGSEPIYVRWGPTGSTIADPTVQGDDCDVVAAGGFTYFDYNVGSDYKLISGGDSQYSVIGERDD